MTPGATTSRFPQDDQSEDISRPDSPSTVHTPNDFSSQYPLLPSHRGRWSADKMGKQESTMNREPKPHDYGAYPNLDRDNVYPAMHARTETNDSYHQENRRSGSWDLLGGIRRLEHSYVEFDPRQASTAHLVFAEGDLPQNAFVKFYSYLLNVSIVTRWILYIIPVLGMIWIPGILGFTKYPDATVWGVRLLWWSIWLSVVWLSWWGARAVTLALPRVARNTIGVVAVGARRYIDWLQPLGRYIALFAWSLAVWVSFNPLINTRKEARATADDSQALSTAAKIFFAILESCIILLAEKVILQWIAAKFHERSYAERVAQQKFAVRVLVMLYRHSSAIPWRSDTLQDDTTGDRPQPRKRGRLLKRALHGVKVAATTTTTAFGNVASEIAGSSVLQPNSPQAVIKTALESANKSRMLARRLFYSFVKPGAHSLTVQDIARFFPTPEDADAAFGLFDKDMNGDATRDEMEIACMECHREQLSIEHSMRDLDSAVGRLDNILMTLYVFIVILLVAVAFEAQLLTLATTAGTFILSLSWLVGSSFVETLTSIIFLFVKHPYDVGDRIAVDGIEYTVKEIRLLSTVMLDGGNTCVQAPHSLLNTKLVMNMRRSAQMSESFEFDVAYATTFEQIERLRELMLTFVKAERRDYQPSFDISIIDLPDQEKMSLAADIRYKSNWQQGALKATRRNKWITALKTAMAQAEVYGPKGPPDPPPPVDRVTLVPWDKIEEEDRKVQAEKDAEERKKQRAGAGKGAGTVEETLMQMPQQWTLSDHDAIIMDESRDVFDQDTLAESLPPTRAPSPRRTHATGSPVPIPQRHRVPAAQGATPSPGSQSTSGSGEEEIELQATPSRTTPARSQTTR